MNKKIIMKKMFCLVAASLFTFSLPGFAFGYKVTSCIPGEPKAVLDKMTIDYKANENGVNGMMLHLTFTAYDMKDIESSVAIYFMYNDYHRGILKDTNQKYYSSAGDVAVYKSLKPAFSPAFFEDLQIFIPYDELDLLPGDYDLTMDVKLIFDKGGLISELGKENFRFTKPLPNTSTIPTASIDSIRIDQNIAENNKTGMRISLNKFSISGMKDTDCFLAIYFEKKDRTKLQAVNLNSSYRSQGGQIAIFQALTLPYDVSVYDNLAQFIPYEELGLGKGKHELRMDMDVIYKNGTLLKHIRFHEFQLEL